MRFCWTEAKQKRVEKAGTYKRRKMVAPEADPSGKQVGQLYHWTMFAMESAPFYGARQELTHAGAVVPLHFAAGLWSGHSMQACCANEPSALQWDLESTDIARHYYHPGTYFCTSLCSCRWSQERRWNHTVHALQSDSNTFGIFERDGNDNEDSWLPGSHFSCSPDRLGGPHYHGVSTRDALCSTHPIIHVGRYGENESSSWHPLRPSCSFEGSSSTSGSCSYCPHDRIFRMFVHDLFPLGPTYPSPRTGYEVIIKIPRYNYFQLMLLFLWLMWSFVNSCSGKRR